MRTKFRAWHKAEKKMCDVSLINFDKGAFLEGVEKGEDYYSDDGKTIIHAPKNGRFCEWDEIELIQFTGLFDKNGVEVYEGDICRTHYWEKQPDGGCILSDKYKRFKNVVIEYNAKTPFCGYTIHDWYEVIGNVYSNSELLK